MNRKLNKDEFESKTTMNWSEKRVLVTGAAGFLGSHLVNQLQKAGAKDIVTPSSKEYDLRKNENCKKVVRDIDIVFNLAGRIGGIEFNKQMPGELFYDNLMIGTQLLHEAKMHQSKNLLPKVQYVVILNLVRFLLLKI